MSAPLLLHVFATFTAAGPQLRVCRLIDAFGDAYRHVIVAGDGRTDAKDLLPPDADVTLRDAPTTRKIGGYRRLLRELRPDLLLTYNWGSFDAVLAARTTAGLRHVHHEDGFNADEADGQKARRVWARRLALRGCDHVVVCSKTLERIARESWRLGASKTAWIPNGIDAARFRGGDGARLRAELDIPTEATVIGAVGHLRPVKNLARLLEAAHRLSHPVHVLLVGDGDERPALERQAAARPPRGGAVRFAGHRADLRDAYAAMDLFCMSSDSEQHPVALLEAMAAGVPAVATAVGDVAHVLGDTAAARIVPLEGGDDAGALAAALDAALAQDDAARLEVVTEQTRRVEELYEFDGMVRAYRALYDEVRAGG